MLNTDISTVLDAGTFMPKEVLGEEAYVKFVTSFDPDALRGDALRYKVSVIPYLSSCICMRIHTHKHTFIVRVAL